MSYLKKKLSLHFKSTAELLLKLQGLKGLVYLEDYNNPIIGLLPQQYYLIQNQENQIFKRNNIHRYTPSFDTPTLIEFTKFTHPKNEKEEGSAIHFTGGYIGFISYDYAAQQHAKIKSHVQPSLFLGCYNSFLKYENHDWYFYSNEADGLEIYQHIEKIIHFPIAENEHAFKLQTSLSARWSKDQYLNVFHKILDYIKAGDCYQINLTQEFIGNSQGLLLKNAEKLWELTNAPYAGYLQHHDFELISCSPELFIEFKASKEIKTRPIKGTMPRYNNQAQDEVSKQTLRNSQKDQAENVMIVDLLRNDLSIYANIGSVKTTKLFEIESFNQVHHMVSEIVATLKDEVNPMQMLLTALPGGSITGAPKIRAMQIIEELEEAPRGAYCGTLGYFNFDGSGRWNILIRSFQQYQNQLSLWAGGGITIASQADAEYQECFDKVSAMLNLMNSTADE